MLQLRIKGDIHENVNIAEDVGPYKKFCTSQEVQRSSAAMLGGQELFKTVYEVHVEGSLDLHS